MALEAGLRYTVPTHTRWTLFLQEENEPNSQQTHQEPVSSRTKNEDHAATNKTNQNSRTQRIAPTTHAVQSKNRGVPVRNIKPTTASNEVATDHQKAEHRQQRKGHIPPKHGREFDRHSGSAVTGVKAVAKKDGYGTGNWGTVKDEIEATMADNNEPLDESNENINDESQEPAAPPTLTLEEYKAMQAGKYIASKDSSRAPNDGKDVFKDMKLVKSNKPVVELLPAKFASVYHTTNESGIALTISHKPNSAARDGYRGGRRRGGERPVRRGGSGRGGFQGDRERQPREEGSERKSNDEGNRGNRRGGSSARGAPRGAGPRGSRGAAQSGETRAKGVSLNDSDFPPLS